MQWIRSARVGTRLIGGFLVVAAIGAVIGLTGIVKSGQINDMAVQMYERETVGLRHVAETNMHLLAVGRHVRGAILATSDADRRVQVDAVEDRMGRMHASLDTALGGFATAEGQALVADAQAAARAYEQGVRLVLEALRSEPPGEARASVARLVTLRIEGDRADGLMSQLVERKYGTARELSQATGEVYASVQWLMMLLTFGGVVAGIGIGVVLTRGLTRQLGGEPAQAAEAAGAIAGGDLSTVIDTSRAAPGSVIAAMHQMQASLRRVVGTVRASSDSIATGSSQIASGNADLSQRTEEQASNLQQTAASMEQLSGTVRNNAEAARQASALAGGARAVATRGGEVVERVVATMGEISASSRRIADITAVIDGIAFQTNILALNAAVEAARAGEQGRGFAVVAAEVRTLAQRSAEAARQIKGLIDDSVGRVEAGSRQVSEAGTTMGDIVAQVTRVSNLIAEITAATTEQTQGIGQVSDAVLQLDQVTQQNAALVEEAAAAADSLSQQARRLVQAVSVFKLDAVPAHVRAADAAMAAAAAPPVAAPRVPPAPLRQQAVPEPAWQSF